MIRTKSREIVEKFEKANRKEYKFKLIIISGKDDNLFQTVALNWNPSEQLRHAVWS